MHELSIITSIIEIAEDEARKHNSARIKKIKLRIGEFTGVVREALEFSFEFASRGTMAEGSKLEIEMVKLKAECVKCKKIYNSIDNFNFLCPSCKDPLEIISGREMQIEYIELD